MGIQAVKILAVVSLTALAAAAEEPKGAQTSWIKELRTRAGDQPVLLVRKPDGAVVGQTPDGKVSLPLITDAPADVLLDPGFELLWLHRKDSVDVVDLRQAKPVAIPIARGLPPDAGFVVSVDDGGDGLRSVFRQPGCERDMVVNLQWLSVPSLELIDKPRGKGTFTKAGKEWLRANRERGGERRLDLADFAGSGEPSKVTLPPKVAHCFRPGDCGHWLPFGPGGWRLVLTGMQAKDRCHLHQCLIFDPKTNNFASPVEPKKWGKADEVQQGSCGPFEFDQAGHFYLSGSKACSVQGGCTDLGGEAIGWMKPGAMVGEPG